MNEKNFYSFYKLNDDEKARLKEKISENNIQNPNIINLSDFKNIRNDSWKESSKDMNFSWGDNSVPEETVRKKSGKIVPIVFSVGIFVLGVFVGKFMPDKNNNNRLKNYVKNFYVNNDISAEIEDIEDGFIVTVNNSGIDLPCNNVKICYNNPTLSKGNLYHIEFDYASSEVMEFRFALRNDYKKNFYFSEFVTTTVYNSPKVNHYSRYFVMHVDDVVTFEFDCYDSSVETPYSMTFENISLSHCELDDDFDHDAGNGVGYYDKNKRYHKYEG